MTNQFGLTQKTIDKINAVFAKYPAVEEVVIYGSRAVGNYRPGSDIDLTFMGNIADPVWTAIYFDLDALLTPYTFDLSLFSTIENADLVDHIRRVGKIFYKKDSFQKNN